MANRSRVAVVLVSAHSLVLALALALALGCGDRPPPSAPRPAPRPATPPAAIQPQAYVLGAGVPRDYRRAAALYAERCADGCGELAACHSLYELVIDSRGMVPRVEHIGVLMRMCQRGDPLGCAITTLMGFEDTTGKASSAMDDVSGRCAKGDPSACEVELMFAYLDGGVGPVEEPIPEERVVARLDARMKNAASQLCRRGMAKACRVMVERETYACRTSGPARDCVAAVSADRREKGIDPTPLAVAWERTRDACRAGDADACALVPGREVPARALCDAGDYLRCAELGEQGDAHAARLACEAGIGARCAPPRPASGTAGAVVAAVRRLHEQCETTHDAEACRAMAPLRSPPPCR